MQLRNLATLLGGSGRRSVSQATVPARLACALLKQVRLRPLNAVLPVQDLRMEAHHG